VHRELTPPWTGFSSEIASSPTFELSEWEHHKWTVRFFVLPGRPAKDGNFSTKKIDSRAPDAEIKLRYFGNEVTWIGEDRSLVAQWLG
jgi:hypothetical protein